MLALLALAAAPEARAQSACAMDNGVAVATGIGSLACGEDAEASGNFSTAIGTGAKALEERNVAVGARANAEGLYSTAIGTATEATMNRATAIGVHAEALSIEGTAVGAGAEVTGTFAVGVGSDAVASGHDATAMGHAASATADNSVALGANSTSTRAGTVSVGNEEMGMTRQLTNVARATHANDAVNFAQFNERMSLVDDRFRDIDRRIDRQDKRIDGLGAMTAAMAQMSAGAAAVQRDNRVAAGIGTQNGETALALGYQRSLRAGGAALTLGAAFTGDDASIGAGVGFGW
jgi:autotransporter adhesin